MHTVKVFEWFSIIWTKEHDEEHGKIALMKMCRLVKYEQSSLNMHTILESWRELGGSEYFVYTRENK